MTALRGVSSRLWAAVVALAVLASIALVGVLAAGLDAWRGSVGNGPSGTPRALSAGPSGGVVTVPGPALPSGPPRSGPATGPVVVAGGAGPAAPVARVAAPRPGHEQAPATGHPPARPHEHEQRSEPPTTPGSGPEPAPPVTGIPARPAVRPIGSTADNDGNGLAIGPEHAAGRDRDRGHGHGHGHPTAARTAAAADSRGHGHAAGQAQGHHGGHARDHGRARGRGHGSSHGHGHPHGPARGHGHGHGR